MANYALILVLALTFALTGTPIAKWIALRLGVVDRPSVRKVHSVVTPLLGGLAIYAACALALLLFWNRGELNQVIGILTAATWLVILGFLDDSGKLHSQFKLLIGMPIATLVLIFSGVQASIFGNPLLNIAITFVWVVGITAAFNLLDNMDGLAAGAAAVASIFFLIVAAVNQQELVGILAAAVLGASLGFLRYNFNPAQIFMGDAGALFLGFMMAVLGLKIRFLSVPESVSWAVPIFILGIPIFDTTLVTISRLRRGLNPMATPGKDHFSHRLVALGMSHRRAVLTIYLIGVGLGLIALLISQIATPFIVYGIVVFCGALGLVCIALLERVKFTKVEGQ